MTTNFVLIDYENVQPTELASLQRGPFKVKLFLGANQSKIPVAFAAALHRLDAEYLLLESAGSNALDFHIAYYIGVLSVQEPSARFHIISKDTGFDPLIKHLRLRGVLAQRLSSISAIPSAKQPADGLADAEQISLAVAHLGKLKAAKPRTEKALRGTLRALFKKELSEDQISALFAGLCQRGVVKVNGTKVTYEVSGP